VVDHLSNQFRGKTVGIAYIYCNYKKQGEETSVNLIASLLKQLVQERPFISKDVKNLYEEHINKETRPSVTECLRVLRLEMGRHSKIFFIIDALDECSEDTQGFLLDRLRALQAGKNLNLIITSRPQVSIKQVFKEAKLLEVRARDEDVRNYLQERISSPRRLVQVVNAALQKDILDTITENAKGMYVCSILLSSAQYTLLFSGFSISQVYGSA
jgi:KAP family P-loop domain